MKQIKVPPSKSGGLMLSYKCTAACRHCMYACSQKWKSDWISEEDLAIALSEAQQLPERVELFLMGRAASRLKSFYPAYPARTFFKEPCRPSFLRDWHNHFDNYGNVVAGYCGGISLGHWKDLQNLIVDFERQPVLKYLIEEDMEGLFKFATEHGFQESDDGYVSNCHLCLDIRRHLVKNGEFPELSPKAFYENLE